MIEFVIDHFIAVIAIYLLGMITFLVIGTWGPAIKTHFSRQGLIRTKRRTWLIVLCAIVWPLSVPCLAIAFIIAAAVMSIQDLLGDRK